MPTPTATARRRTPVGAVVAALVAALVCGLVLAVVPAQAATAQVATAGAAATRGGAVPGATAAATCTPNQLFAVRGNGEIRPLNADGPRVTGSAPVAAFSIEHNGGSFNALAVSADGSTFWAVERWSDWWGRDFVDVVRHDRSRQTRVASGYQVSGSAIAGALDPATGSYYVGVSQGSSLVIHRFTASGGGSRVGALSVSGMGGTVNGDFAFDAAGNLFFIASSTSNYRVYTLPRAELTAADGTIRPSATGPLLANRSGAAFNGVSFSPDTYAFASTDDTITAFDPNTMSAVAAPSRPGFSGITDLASCHSPSTLTLQKDIAARAGADDQFTLRVSRAGSNGVLGEATTSGRSTGVQEDAVVGPVPALAGQAYVVAEIGSGTTDLSRYDVSLQCTNTTTGRPVTVEAAGAVGSYRLTFPPTSGGLGSAVVCTLVNSFGSYAVTKTADPASGTQVEPGRRITYSVGVVATGAVRGVVLTDDLSDVLDDATFVAGSARLVVAGGAPVAVPDPSRGTLTGPAFDLADGQRATLTYAVDVRDDAWSARLRNVVTGRDAGGKVPSTCTTAAPCATEHTTPEPGTYAVTKTADPATGATVEPGRQLTYTVTTTAADGPVRDVVLTDDLTDVLDDATFVAGSAQLTVAGGRPGAVPDPRGTTLTSPAFDLDAGQTATLTYAVQVRDDAWSATLRNVVTAVDGRGVPPTTCTDAAPCATEHSTPSRLQVEKVGEAVDGTWVPMAGSAWALRADADGTPGAVLTTPAVTPVDGQTGRFVATGLAAGTYWLEETKAPAGFSLLAQPVRFTIGAGGAVTLADDDGGGVVTVADDDGDGTWTLTVRDVPALELPETGGGGTRPYVTAGAGLLAVAAALALLTARHRRRT